MDQRTILHQISELASRIQTVQERISANASSANSIEVALLKNLCLDLYEQITLFERLPLAVVEQGSEKAPEIEASAPETVVPATEEVVIEQSDSLLEPEEEENVLRTPEPLVEKTGLEKVEVQPVIPETSPESEENQLRIPLKQEKLEKKEIVKAQETKTRPTVHDKASTSPGTKIYEKFNQARIESIRKNISLMKRFEFQKALFKDNPDYYNDAIRFFDDAGSLADAINEFEELGSHFGWDMENALVLELRELISRRHM